MPALSSSPGQAPTHEERHFSEGKVAAVGPTSARICCAESTPRPGISASRSTASWCWLSRLAISWSSWLISQSGQSRWVGFPVSERLQHPPGTEAQQIGDETGQLDMGLFQKRLQLVLQPHPIAPQLVLLARYLPPQTLLGIGHKAQSQFPGHQPLHQAFGVGEIPLASPSSAIGLRLRQMQRSGPPPCAFSLLAYRLPIPFQRSPHRFPILGRRLHDYFFGLLLDEPRSQRSQLFGVAAKHTPLKLVFAFDFNVGHNYSQHLLVDIDSRYPVRHRLLLAGSGERAAITLTGVAGYRRSPGEKNDAQLFAQTRTLRIRQT